MLRPNIILGNKVLKHTRVWFNFGHSVGEEEASASIPLRLYLKPNSSWGYYLFSYVTAVTLNTAYEPK